MPRSPASTASRGAAWAVLLASGVGLSLWACAPPSTLPAPVPLAKSDGLELGGGATLSLGVGEDCRLPEAEATDTGFHEVTCSPAAIVLPDLTHWGLVPIHDRLAVGWTLAGGMGSPGLVGGAVGRLDLSRSERVFIGPQVELGMAWGALGLPASLQVRDRLWLYTHPSMGYRMNGMVRAPVGLALDVGERMRLDMEAGLAMSMIQGTYTRYDAMEGSRMWVSAGLSRRLGR